MNAGNIKKWITARKTRRSFFFFGVLFLPLVQFLLFYVYVNFNSIVMSFQEYTLEAGKSGFVINFTLDNFSVAWNKIRESTYLFKNTFYLFLVELFLQYPLALIFSNYIYKKWPGAGFFKVILFMPQLISGMIFGLLYKYIVTDVYIVFNPESLGGLLDVNNLATARITVIAFCVLLGFGVNVLLFSGSMSGINESIVESAQLDGANNIQEFFYITLPLIWSTIVQLFVVSLGGIFTQQMHLYTLYGNGAYELSTMGYFLYMQTKDSALISPNPAIYLNYPQLSALGLTLTLIVVPITLATKKLLTKFGPSV